MKKFEIPEVEIKKFFAEDVITSSTGTGTGGGGDHETGGDEF